eukprot:10380739-Lingulodinium_polyedra.AAC.1
MHTCCHAQIGIDTRPQTSSPCVTVQGAPSNVAYRDTLLATQDCLIRPSLEWRQPHLRLGPLVNPQNGLDWADTP